MILNTRRIEEVDAQNTDFAKELVLCLRMAREGLNAIKDEYSQEGIGCLDAENLKKIELGNCHVDSYIDPILADWLGNQDCKTITLNYETNSPIGLEIAVRCKISRAENGTWVPESVKLSDGSSWEVPYCYHRVKDSDICYCLDFVSQRIDTACPSR